MQATADLGAAIARHFEQTFRLVNDERAVRADNYFRLITGEPHPLGNLAIFGPNAMPGEASKVLQPLCSGAFPAAVVFQEGVSPEMFACLTDLGFEASGNMPCMSVEIDRLETTQLPAGYRFTRVGLEQSREWTEAMAVGYGLPQGLSDLFSPAAMKSSPAEDADIQWFGAYQGEEVAAVSVLMLHSGLAGIYCVATKEGHRGKGLGAHVTAEPLRVAQQLGYRTGILQSSQMGFPVYERLGFVPVGEGMPFFARMS